MKKNLHVNIKIHSTKQYSETLVEYDEGFDMTTGKLKYTPHITHHPLNEGTSYIPVNRLKTQEILVEK